LHKYKYSAGYAGIEGILW